MSVLKDSKETAVHVDVLENQERLELMVLKDLPVERETKETKVYK